MTLLNPEIGGFDLEGELDACASYNDSSSSCISAVGTLDKKAKVTARYAILRLERYKGKSEMDGVERIVEERAFAPGIEASKVPIVGTLVQGSLDYTSLKVKAGQTIRILARIGLRGHPNGGNAGLLSGDSAHAQVTCGAEKLPSWGQVWKGNFSVSAGEVRTDVGEELPFQT